MSQHTSTSPGRRTAACFGLFAAFVLTTTAVTASLVPTPAPLDPVSYADCAVAQFKALHAGVAGLPCVPIDPAAADPCTLVGILVLGLFGQQDPTLLGHLAKPDCSAPRSSTSQVDLCAVLAALQGLLHGTDTSAIATPTDCVPKPTVPPIPSVPNPCDLLKKGLGTTSVQDPQNPASSLILLTCVPPVPSTPPIPTVPDPCATLGRVVGVLGIGQASTSSSGSNLLGCVPPVPPLPQVPPVPQAPDVCAILGKEFGLLGVASSTQPQSSTNLLACVPSVPPVPPVPPTPDACALLAQVLRKTGADAAAGAPPSGQTGQNALVCVPPVPPVPPTPDACALIARLVQNNGGASPSPLAPLTGQTAGGITTCIPPMPDVCTSLAATLHTGSSPDDPCGVGGLERDPGKLCDVAASAVYAPPAALDSCRTALGLCGDLSSLAAHPCPGVSRLVCMPNLSSLGPIPAVTGPVPPCAPTSAPACKDPGVGVVAGTQAPSICDPFGTCGPCFQAYLAAQQAAGAVAAVGVPTPNLPGSSGKQTSILGIGGSAGRWSIQFSPTAADVLPDGTRTDGAADQAFAAVGGLSVDIPDQGTVHQDSKVLEGTESTGTDTRQPDSVTNAYLGTGACFFAIGVVWAMGTGGAAVFDDNPIGWGALGVAIGAAALTCGIAWALNADNDYAGYITCGYFPAGVTWGGQDSRSNLASSLSPTAGTALRMTSTSNATTTTYVDAAGNKVQYQYIPVHVHFVGYKQGLADCNNAYNSSHEAAEALAAQYGTVKGGGSATITALVNLQPVVNEAAQFSPLGNGLYFSPVMGLAVSCDSPSDCPLQVRLDVTECGTVAIKGGTAAEMTYAFTGDPTSPLCTPSVTVTVGDTSGGVSSPVGVPIVLSNQYEGASNGAL